MTPHLSMREAQTPFIALNRLIYPFSHAMDSVYPLKTHCFTGTMDRCVIGKWLDKCAGSSMQFETVQHCQQKSASKTVPTEAWMDTDWLDLRHITVWVEPAHTESDQ